MNMQAPFNHNCVMESNTRFAMKEDFRWEEYDVMDAPDFPPAGSIWSVPRTLYDGESFPAIRPTVRGREWNY